MSMEFTAREVLFHLNYMGFRNITKEQLKAFMTDLKTLIKYETGPKKYFEERSEAGPCSDNVQRMFESQKAVAKSKKSEIRQEDKPEAPKKQPLKQRTKSRENVHTSADSRLKENVDSRAKENAAEPKAKNSKDSEAPKATSRPSRICSANTASSRRRSSVNTIEKPETSAPTGGRTIAKKKPDQSDKDKENVPAKSKMWIRPRSASQSGRTKKTDPVSLYQAYQKDWERFKSNICESSHSELRWNIREKMLSRQ